jgi:signal transduction histidine kinase
VLSFFRIFLKEETAMLKNILRIPDTFDPDDRRRRQVLNVLLIANMFSVLVAIMLSLLIIYYHVSPLENKDSENLIPLLMIFGLIMGGLLVFNRSPRIPGWVSAAIFIALMIIIATQSDTPQELYGGRSLMYWVIPIMVSAIVLPPESVFMIAAIISALLQIFSYNNAHGSTDYYAIAGFFFIAFLSWLGMSIANRAIRDARREAANNKAILNSIADGVLVLNQNGKFFSANPALRRMIPEEELMEIISKPLEETIRWKRKVFSVTTSEVPEVGTVAVFRDETRRHETERARDALIATASHELRTPLAATMNYLELTLMLVKLGRVNMDEFKENLTRALENSKRLQGLVDNILDQAQIQAGVLELKNQPFDLHTLFEKTRQLLDVLIQEKNLSYELSIAQNVPVEIMGDADRLHQVLVNLIGNAIKFTNQGGIKVRVSAPQKEKLSIEVADSGAGIPPEQLPDIFETFRRGSNYAQRERQGAGLGLSIAKEIIARMGGEISAASELGRGSTFTVMLPLETT